MANYSYTSFGFAPVDPTGRGGETPGPINDFVNDRTYSGRNPTNVKIPAGTYGGGGGQVDLSGGKIQRDNFQIAGSIDPDAFRLPGEAGFRTRASSTFARQPKRLLGEEAQSTLNLLQQQAQGQGPSIAENILRQGADEAVSQQLALASQASRSGDTGLALRSGAQNAATIQQGAARDAGTLRAQEILAAREQLANFIGQQQQQQLAENAALEQRKQFYESLGFNRDAAIAQAKIDLEKTRAGIAVQEKGIQAGVGINNTQSQNQLLAAGIQAGGAALVGLLSSDENVKENVEDADDLTKDFLDKISAKAFNYKWDSKEDRKLGVMAQDVEKSAMGKKMVRFVNGHKALDTKDLMSALLASNALMNKRLNKVESRA